MSQSAPRRAVQQGVLHQTDDRRQVGASSVPKALSLLPFGALWYAAILTSFHFNMMQPEKLGQVYNDMLVRLLHWDFTISPKAIGFEAFIHGGRTYTYFGILPALLRLPFWATGTLNGIDWGNLSCLTADTLWLAMSLRTLDEVEQRMAPTQRLPALQWAIRIAILLCGPELYLLSDGSIYHEAALWAMACAASAIMIVLRCAANGRTGGRNLAWLAFLAGLALNARPSIGAALCIAFGLLWLHEAALILRRGWGMRALLPLLPAATIILVCGSGAAVVNFERWGHPFEFANYADYPVFMRHPRDRIMLAQYGALSLSRLWYGLLYYATGIAYFLQKAPLIGPWLYKHYYNIGGIPIGMIFLMPLQLALAVLGLRRWARSEYLGRDSQIILGCMFIGQFFAVVLVLCYYAVYVRYESDFLGFIMLACFLGYPGAAAALNRLPRLSPGHTATFCLIITLGSAAACHCTLVLGKMVDEGVHMASVSTWLDKSPSALQAPHVGLTTGVGSAHDLLKTTTKPPEVGTFNFR